MNKTAVKKRHDNPEAWQKVEEEFTFLTDAEFASALADKSRSCMGLYISGQIMALPKPGGLRFPDFQIDPRTRAVRPVIRDLIKLAMARGRSEKDVILWLCLPSPIFRGKQPVNQLRNASKLLTAATQALDFEW